MRVLCRDCYVMIEGDSWFPATIGRSTCEECGLVADECYETEQADGDE